MTEILDDTLYKSAFFGSGTKEIPLICVELLVPGEDPVRMVRDFSPLVHDGETYDATPDMEVAPPASRRGEISSTVIAFGDADNSRIAALRSIPDEFPVRMFVVLASHPDTIVKGPYDLVWQREEKSGAIVRGVLAQDDAF